MPVRKLALGVVAMAVLVLSALGQGASAQTDLNCDDFSYQDEAQAVLEADPSDPNDLDLSDKDGRACENLPVRQEEVTDPIPAPATTVPTIPSVPTVETPGPSAGSQASTPTTAMPSTGIDADRWGGFAACLLVLGTCFVVASRRRRRWGLYRSARLLAPLDRLGVAASGPAPPWQPRYPQRIFRMAACRNTNTDAPGSQDLRPLSIRRAFNRRR